MRESLLEEAEFGRLRPPNIGLCELVTPNFIEFRALGAKFGLLLGGSTVSQVWVHIARRHAQTPHLRATSARGGSPRESVGAGAAGLRVRALYRDVFRLRPRSLLSRAPQRSCARLSAPRASSSRSPVPLWRPSLSMRRRHGQGDSPHINLRSAAPSSRKNCTRRPSGGSRPS